MLRPVRVKLSKRQQELADAGKYPTKFFAAPDGRLFAAYKHRDQMEAHEICGDPLVIIAD